MTILRWVGALALALLLAPCVEAQTASSVQAPAGYAPMQAPCVKQADGTCEPVTAAKPMPVTGGRQEAFALATANTASAPATVYGGDYIWSQSCTGYNSGTRALQVLGPDGSTYQTLVSKTASDTTGGTGLALGGGAVVRDSLPSGSTGCVSTLTRVP